ncbi:reverse transcriptase domain-containing protein [Tanacetum coccineum]
MPFCGKEGIVLEHKISKAGIEVDKAKVDVIASLPYPINVKDFELMCDASDYAVGAVLGQRIKKKFRLIYYASKTMNNAQENYTTTEKELLAVELTIEIKDKKRTANLAADHHSRLENPVLEELNEDTIQDNFPDKHLMVIKLKNTETDPWYADYANFLVFKIVPQHLTYYLRKKFLNDVRKYIWDDPYLFKSCPGGIIRRFGVPKALISDRGTHFCNSLLEKTLKKYGVTHRLATPYHPQTNGQTKNTNRAIKRILKRTVNENRKKWADKLDNALWAFRTTYKTPIGSTPFRIVYEKACHLPIELEHKAYLALKTTKRWHDSKIMDKEFQEREEVLVFNSRLKLFPGKLRTRWYGPYTVSKVYPYGTVEVLGKNEVRFKKKCEECKYDKISYDKAYNDMQPKIERLQAQLGDHKGKSKDASCVSDTLDPLPQKLENENAELEFQVRNYEKENALHKTAYKNLFDSINVTRAQTKTIIDSLHTKLHDTIYENAKLRAQLFDKVSERKDTTKGTSVNTQFYKQSFLGKPPSSF